MVKSAEVNCVLMIGGHGMLGRPVARVLVSEGFRVRAMAREPDRAARLLPDEVEVVRGDLQSMEDIRRAADGVDAITVNLSTTRPDSPFQPERDGINNLLEALRGRPAAPIVKTSALGVTEMMDNWPEADQKREADQRLLESDHPAVILRPSWMMESIPLMIKGAFLMRLGGVRYPIRWLAGEDLGRWTAVALRNSDAWNRCWPAQGPEALTVDEACRRFAAEWNPRILIIPNPLWAIRLAGTVLPLFRNFANIVEVTNRQQGAFRSEKTWKELGEPANSIEDYAASIRRTGDWPRKSLLSG